MSSVTPRPSDTFSFNTGVPPAPDLTSYISKENNQHIAGGTFGDVYRCWCDDGVRKEVAVKSLRFSCTNGNTTNNGSRQMLRRELGIWRRLDHPNVVPFLGVAYGFGMVDAISLVSLWMPNGSLHRFLENYRDSLGVGHRLQLLLDIANGLRYLHSLSVVHGDLNCNNILLDQDYTARIADFGFASLVGNIPEALLYLQRTTGRSGALRWAAPEQIDPEEGLDRTTKSDIYSLGCVLSGKQPWSEVHGDVAIIYSLAKGQTPGRPKCQTLHDSHWSLIQQCWSPMEKRPRAEAIVSFIRQFLNSCPRSQRLLAPATQGQICLKQSTFNTDVPPAPDLTPYISKRDNQCIAGGGFGDVYKCWCDDGVRKEVAVKALRFRFAIANEDSRTHKMLRRELGIWRRLDHANVVPFLGIAYGFGMSGSMSLVSLWMKNGSLHHFLARYNDSLGVDHRLQFLLDTANGLHYLHSLSVVHGNLNSNNILLDQDYTACIAGFGYVSLLGDIPEALSYLQRSTVTPGALRWIAPEQIDPDNVQFDRRKSDIYFFGCVSLQVLSGKQPWSELREDVAVIFRLAKGLKPGRPICKTLHDSHWNVIQQCWSPIEERPLAEAIISSIQQLMGSCSQSRPLQDLAASWSSQSETLEDD